MKNFVIAICLMIISNNLYCQEVALNHKGDVPDGTYYKDLNGELDKYIGVWVGNFSGKTLVLELKKHKYKLGKYYKDKILGERKVIDSNGFVEMDRISNFDYDIPEFIGLYYNLKNPNIKIIRFYPKDMCNKVANLEIVSIAPNQMTLQLKYVPGIYDPTCKHNDYIAKYGDYPLNFPKNIILHKQ